jgi:hypothetical protein
MVRKERLELSRREALEPKSSVSTNSTTPAKLLPAKVAINLFSSDDAKIQIRQKKVGWTMGFEPTTAGITIQSSTN